MYIYVRYINDVLIILVQTSKMKVEKEVINMANTNITIRIDEEVKTQLQGLLSELGLDMTTFFTMAAKQAVREQALPFKSCMVARTYGVDDYLLAMKNTKFNENGRAVIPLGDEWRDETEWDEMFEEMKKERERK